MGPIALGPRTWRGDSLTPVRPLGLWLCPDPLPPLYRVPRQGEGTNAEAESLFDPQRQSRLKITDAPSAETVKLASELIESQAGKFEPKKMPDEYSRAVLASVKRKVEKRAPEVQVAEKPVAPAKVINIMAALKEGMQKQSRAKVRETVNRRMKLAATKKRERAPKRATRSTPLRTSH
jgi:hypothetical protein